MHKKPVKAIFEHFFSLTCPLCKNSFIKSSHIYCASCIEQLSFIEEPFCNSCGGQIDTVLSKCSKCLKENDTCWDRAISLMNMTGLSRDILIRFKYYSDIPLAKPLAKLCAEKVISSKIAPDIITYIPLHWTKYIKRGFNQSLLISKMIAKELNIAYTSALKRIRYTKSQTKLTGKQRRENLKDAFKVINNQSIENKCILLIDDVYTTGTTLREASKELYNAKAKKVLILTLARR